LQRIGILVVVLFGFFGLILGIDLAHSGPFHAVVADLFHVDVQTGNFQFGVRAVLRDGGELREHEAGEGVVATKGHPLIVSAKSHPSGGCAPKRACGRSGVAIS